MASLKSDCRKFAPNIFNKTKCQNCFRGKDVHSAEALESNRATRKVCLCSYLFVAPDWDFSLPANRNKRWQRRWFVLYDDGELAYSVDECPETVPQAVIDMNCVLEVADAENITGNQFSLAITLPEKVHFVKGTSKEEIRKWLDVLARFPRNTVCGKYKRSATFPGIKSVSTIKSENNFTDWVNRRETVQVHEYPKTNGYVNRKTNAQNSSVKYEPEDVIPTKDTNCSNQSPKSCLDEVRLNRSSAFIKDKVSVNCKMLSKESYGLLNSSSNSSVNTICQKSPVRNMNGNVLSPSNSKSDMSRELAKEKFIQVSDVCQKFSKHEPKENRRHHSRSDITHMIPSTVQENGGKPDWKRVSVDIDSMRNDKNYNIHNPIYMLMADSPSGKQKMESSYEKYVRAEKPHLLQRQSSFGRRSELLRQASSWLEDHVDGSFRNRTIHKSASVPNAVISENESHLKNNTFYNSHFLSGRKSKQHIESKFVMENGNRNASIERGDPDGCNLDSIQSVCSFLGENNSESLSLKKGWLVKQEHSKWNKHWFVLRNSALTYYSDPIAEDAGILDGVVDLRKVQSVSEVESNSGHTFCITMKDNLKLFLSAVTAKMRNNWIRAILHVAKLKSITSEDGSRKIGSQTSVQSPKESFSSPLTRNPSLSSADSESLPIKNFIVEDGDHNRNRHNSVALPPSPPLTRTAISRVKERARSRSHSRSRSSRFNSTEIHESDPSYLADSDDGTTDHSSSSLSNTPVSLKNEEQKPVETPVKRVDDKTRLERRRSLKLTNSESVSYPDRRKKVLEIKDKLEDSSWTIWLDVSKFCKEVEAKLDDIEKSNKHILTQPSNKNNDPEAVVAGIEKKKEVGHLAVCLMKVEKRLHKVHNELEKAKVDLLLSSRERDLETSVSKNLSCHSSIQCDAEVSGMSSQNLALAQQLAKMKEEQKRLKQDLKSAQAASDTFELNTISLKQELKQKSDLHQSQMDLMVARVDDLTTKLLNSEKNVRLLRQRVMKLEQRQERRRSSLKGKEAVSLSKEYEAKLSELEQKICAVEVALKTPDETNGSNETTEKANKESTSLLARLHNLDKKVKDVTDVFDQSTVVDESVLIEDFAKPKICLQVKLDENGSAAAPDTCDAWNSLSLSASMTDLTNTGSSNESKSQTLALSFRDCLENLNYKLSSLVSWLKTNLQLMYDERSSATHEETSALVTPENSKTLRHVIKALEHVSNALNRSDVIRQEVDDIAKDVLFKMVLLQEITNVVFRMSSSEKYKTVILTHHLLRVKQTVLDLEQYLAQKSNVVSVGTQKLSLCNIVANFLFYRASHSPQGPLTFFGAEKLYEEVESSRKRMSSTIYLFKEKFLENFCATILELSENCVSDKQQSPSSTLSSSDSHSDSKPVGQKQFLSHINHIITQVSHSFVSHISKSLNEIYFLSPVVQYSAKWTTHICKLLQEELIRLSAEIKTMCVKYLENDFYSGSKCGVLMEYMHCSIWELAQIISVNSLIEGTLILIKDALYSKIDEQKDCHNLDENTKLVACGSEELEAFHHSLLQRVLTLFSNLPFNSYTSAGWSFCNSGEINVAHRSVSSLLCFRQKLKNAMESERKAFQEQIDDLNKRLNSLKDEQMKRSLGGCKSCVELKQEVSYLQAELDESQAIARSGGICEKCNNLKLEIQKLMEQHERDTFVMQKLEEQEIKLKKQMQDVLEERETYFMEEKKKFEKELHSAQQMLRNMETCYSEDLKSLQSRYEQKLALPQTDVWRSRYIAEIDQLKDLCEKGLEAMEVAHKKLISELEQKHRKELDDLSLERERVLADEAHATAVALEAVRKAHKEELQRQVQLFKEEFVKKMTARFEAETFRKGYEVEMTKIKQEMLAITEKYSNKCMENIALQENIEKMAQELKLCNNQVIELKARNKQLQAHLASDHMQKLEELV